jgi:hypothetical protein
MVYDINGIAHVRVNWTSSNWINWITTEMAILTTFPNGSVIYRANIVGQPVGTHVRFTITVEDNYKNLISSAEFTYDVIGQETPWTIIIIAIGAVAAGTIAGAMIITYLGVKRKQKQEKNRIITGLTLMDRIRLRWSRKTQKKSITKEDKDAIEAKLLSDANGKIKCRYCGALVENGLKYCPACGAILFSTEGEGGV